MQMMNLLRFSIEFEKCKCANIDTLVNIGVNQVYHMAKQITSMTDNELTLFMLNFSNIVFLEKKHQAQGDYEFFPKTLD